MEIKLIVSSKFFRILEVFMAIKKQMNQIGIIEVDIFWWKRDLTFKKSS